MPSGPFRGTAAGVSETIRKGKKQTGFQGRKGLTGPVSPYPKGVAGPKEVPVTKPKPAAAKPSRTGGSSGSNSGSSAPSPSKPAAEKPNPKPKPTRTLAASVWRKGLDPAIVAALDSVVKKDGTSGSGGSGSGGSGGSGSTKTTDPLQEYVNFLMSQRNQLLANQQSQQNTLKGFTQQLIDYLAGVPGQVESDYNNAISQADKFAQTAATGLANLNPNSTVQSYLSGAGASEAQAAQVAARNQNVFGGGGATLYNTAGAIPGTSLASQKAAQMAFARQLPQIQSLAASQAMKNLLFGQGQDLSKFDASSSESLLALRQKQKELEQQDWYNRQKIALARGETRDKSALAWAKLKQSGNIAAANLEVRYSSMTETERHNAAMESAAFARIEAGVKKSARKGLTAYQIKQMKAKAAEIAQGSYKGAVDADGNELPPIDYQAALDEMRKEGITLDVATNALNYYYKPGERKRPYLSFQQRQALSRMGVPKALIEAGMWDPQAAAQAIAIAKKKNR